MFDFSIVTTWFDSLLRDTLGLGNFLSILIECVIVGLLILVAYALLAIALIYMERKVCAFFQCRLGPMRVGKWGIFQVFADVLKMLIKEIFPVDKADKLLYVIAPFLVIIGSVGAFAFMPWNKGAEILDFNVGVFLLTAISSIGVVGIFLAGWSSNNKYSVVSAMRGAVQMISYEMSLCLCLITAVALTGTMSLSGIVESQNDGWLIFKGHIPAIIAFLVFLVAGNAEANRGPFDLAEARASLLQVIILSIRVWASASSIWLSTLTSSSLPVLPPRCSLVVGCRFMSQDLTDLTLLWIISPALYGSWQKHSSSFGFCCGLSGRIHACVSTRFLSSNGSILCR